MSTVYQEELRKSRTTVGLQCDAGSDTGVLRPVRVSPFQDSEFFEQAYHSNNQTAISKASCHGGPFHHNGECQRRKSVIESRRHRYRANTAIWSGADYFLILSCKERVEGSKSAGKEEENR